MTDAPKKRGRKPAKQLTEAQRRVLQELRDFLVEHGFPPSTHELADRLGVSSATAHEQVGQLVKKGFLTREARKARSLRLARPFEEDHAPADLVSIPLLGSVATGHPILAEENILGEVMIERRLAANGRCFALRITGESMRDAGINDGDLVVVRQQPVAENGDIIVALLAGDATVKRLSIRDHAIELRPENSSFQPIPIGPDDDLRVLGKVIGIRRL